MFKLFSVIRSVESFFEIFYRKNTLISFASAQGPVVSILV